MRFVFLCGRAAPLFLSYLFLSCLFLSCLSFAHADDAAPRDEIIVSDTRRDALAEAKAFAEARPGNVDLVPIEDYEDRYAVSLRDALAFVPGVVMQPNFGEDGRLSVRGSGLANNFHLRGVELLLNGVPLNAADGFGDFQEMDLLFASHVNVLKGANAFRTGAASLGGAIEIEGATAKSVDERVFIRAEGGSFGTGRVNARVAEDFGRFDAALAGTWQRQDGFRDHAAQRNERLYANLGLHWNEAVETRAGVLYGDIDQELSGSLSLDDALNTPRAANPASVLQNHQRDMVAKRFFTTTRIETAAGRFLVGGSYAQKTLYHPVPVFVLQDSKDYTGFARYEGGADLFGVPASWTLGMRYRRTNLDGRVRLNFAGAEGPLIGDSAQLSASIEGYGEFRAEFMPRVEAIIGVNYLRTIRDYDDNLDNAEDARIVFKEGSPHLGLLWRPAEGLSFFANAAASSEPPTFSDLTQAGVAGFTPIKAQDALTYEIGARGRLGPLGFELSYYDAAIEGEFVAFAANPLIPAPVFNAGDTVHRGVELLARLALVEDWKGLSVSPRIVYSWNDFHFDADPVYGDNRLAGIAEHVGRAEVAFDYRGFRLAPNVYFQTGENFVDYANIFAAPGYLLAGIEASYEIAPGAALFLEARNLADRGYVLNYSTLADARLAPSLSVFTPGEGRAVFAGIRVGFGGRP
ncbi:MAG: TonB-dependent receptor family protein [Amphiplicatus sp.]